MSAVQPMMLPCISWGRCVVNPRQTGCENILMLSRGAYVQYLRPNAHENTTRLSFELASGETLEADGTWAWHAATNDLVSLRQCYEGLKDMLINKMDSNSLQVARVYLCYEGTSSA